MPSINFIEFKSFEKKWAQQWALAYGHNIRQDHKRQAATAVESRTTKYLYLMIINKSFKVWQCTMKEYGNAHWVFSLIHIIFFLKWTPLQSKAFFLIRTVSAIIQSTLARHTFQAMSNIGLWNITSHNIMNIYKHEEQKEQCVLKAVVLTLYLCMWILKRLFINMKNQWRLFKEVWVLQE